MFLVCVQNVARHCSCSVRVEVLRNVTPCRWVNSSEIADVMVSSERVKQSKKIVTLIVLHDAEDQGTEILELSGGSCSSDGASRSGRLQSAATRLCPQLIPLSTKRIV